MSTYGFGGGGIALPEAQAQRTRVDTDALGRAAEAGRALGFEPRDAAVRRKPGPKRREPQVKMSIAGPARVLDSFRAYCDAHGLTQREGIERLMREADGVG